MRCCITPTRAATILKDQSNEPYPALVRELHTPDSQTRGIICAKVGVPFQDVQAIRHGSSMVPGGFPSQTFRTCILEPLGSLSAGQCRSRFSPPRNETRFGVFVNIGLQEALRLRCNHVPSRTQASLLASELLAAISDLLPFAG